MIRLWLAIAGLGGLLSVAAGAAAAHLATADSRGADLLRIGAVYGMVHAAALLAAAALAERRERPGFGLGVAGCGFTLGILLFSFSLFALALTGIELFGRITPFGGAAFMIGWAALGISALRRR
jgi:uncharacterized membrane protein YgdD (TMEM256/DUF423 family)